MNRRKTGVNPTGTGGQSKKFIINLHNTVLVTQGIKVLVFGTDCGDETKKEKAIANKQRRYYKVSTEGRRLK